MRGQALVEFALVLPILLMLIVGGAGVGLLLIHRMEIQHAAQEVAVEAGQTNCTVALLQVDEVLGYQPDATSCDIAGQFATVRVTQGFPSLVPFLPETISIEARAIVRQ
jgi:hypothetical protein